ncbi:hypothetical protein F5884DRAFT_809011 [Xylogone sp. PMI_703]|nr:hypothetical protein F5884DRAFT_809011 [Xylogone sp. PMI_703]
MRIFSNNMNLNLRFAISIILSVVVSTTSSSFLGRSSRSIVTTSAYLATRDVPNCNGLGCDRVCIVVYSTPNCEAERPLNTNGTVWLLDITAIGDTSGSILPFTLTSQNPMKIMSLSYAVPTVGSGGLLNCPYFQFDFYHPNNQIAGFTYIIPGQNYTPCISFSSEVVAYTGTTMLVPVPTGLLEWADNFGNVQLEDEYQL